MSFLLWLWACSRAPVLPPGEAPERPLTLTGQGAPVVRLLDQLANAELVLPDHNLGPGGATGGRYVLGQGWTREERARTWRVASPVELPQAMYRSAPPGYRLERGGQTLPFAIRTAQVASTLDGWEYFQGGIYLAALEDPGEGGDPVVLVYEPTAERERRLNLSLSALSPADFARHRVTLGPQTRDALLLPAPGRASFSVTVPPGGQLKFGYGIVEDALIDHTARADFSVRLDGREIWSGAAESGEEWVEVAVDLSEHAGQTVSLDLHTATGADSIGDHCAFGTPEVMGAATEAGPRRVVIVGIDTLAVQHLGVMGHSRDTSPNLDALAAQSWIFPNARAPAPRTRPSFRTVFTGRWPLAAIQTDNFGAVLRRQGFVTGGIVANIHLTPRLGFADGFDWWDWYDSADAQSQVDRALAWSRAHQERDSLLFVHFMDPHVFYLAPGDFQDRYTKGLDPGRVPDRYNRWMIERIEQEEGALSEGEKAFMEARYDGEIAYLDHELGRLVRALDALPGQTLLVVQTDHGEEFWEHGAFEHNHTVYDEVIKSLLWFRPPGGLSDGPHRLDAAASLADIAPTLYALLGVPEADWPLMDGRSLMPLLRPDRDPAVQRALEDRPLPLGHMMFATERWGVVWRGWKYILHTGEGKEELYNLSEDPGELVNLAERSPQGLAEGRQALAEATGYPTGPGWRIRLISRGGAFTMQFPAPIEAAGVIDPEATASRRANLEWGEVPPVLAEDVAAVTVSPDRMQVEVVPGRRGIGTLYVLGPTEETRATVQTASGSQPLRPGRAFLAGAGAKVKAGTLIVPDDSEAARLAAIGDPDAWEALKALGYVQ